MWYSGLRDKYHSEKWFTSWTLSCPISNEPTATVWETDRRVKVHLNNKYLKHLTGIYFWFCFCMSQFEETMCHHFIRSDQHFNTHTHTRTNTHLSHALNLQKYLQYSQESRSPVQMEDTHTHTHTYAYSQRSVWPVSLCTSLSSTSTGDCQETES